MSFFSESLHFVMMRNVQKYFMTAKIPIGISIIVNEFHWLQKLYGKTLQKTRALAVLHNWAYGGIIRQNIAFELFPLKKNSSQHITLLLVGRNCNEKKKRTWIRFTTRNFKINWLPRLNTCQRPSRYWRWMNHLQNIHKLFIRAYRAYLVHSFIVGMTNVAFYLPSSYLLWPRKLSHVYERATKSREKHQYEQIQINRRSD